MKKLLGLLAVLALAGGFASCNKGDNENDGREAVDLGLVDADGNPIRIKWAVCNVGARYEIDPGSYFAWGETSPKADSVAYSWDNYAWGKYDEKSSPLYGMTKYTGDADGGDGLSTLKSEDDPATKNWGKKWRTPTLDECMALLSQCTWTWDGARKGYLVENTTLGTSIFLPAAGLCNDKGQRDVGNYGAYWTSTRKGTYAYLAHYFYITATSQGWGESHRSDGFAVRAVTEY